ncbi:DUF4199 domain-containing protein [Flavobacterium sp. HXWNR69]|uniref:DUF4199 domain-containing protein n=1 Tax=Flavobacterium fragile TaxID=2949085 RepID=A0ABT0TFR5_9FLAO|nr:DUF4199 domain-containing protein [Flavobacterium sp. HXWNR69]MCL9769245.1 DUF4199 domain-containing protein [Flavobacterium sp. HXWNR69]
MNEIIKKNGINFGIILGILGITSQMIVYAMGGISKENAILNSVLQFIFWMAYLVVRIIQCNKTKKEFNGFISLKELFTTLTITILIGILISQSFTFLFNNFIDAAYGELLNKFMNEQQILAQNAMKSFTKVSNEDLKKIAETNNFSILNIAQGTLIAFLVSSIMNLILAAIFKKNQPVF